jgi:hypothetical protein
MPIPSQYLQKKKMKARMPAFRTTYIPPEFEQGLSIRVGAAAVLGAANTQIADETASAFIAIDRRRGGGLARPVSAKVAMRDYGPELQAAMGNRMDDVSLGKGHLFKAAPAYDAATGTVFVNADLTLLHTKTWRALHNPSLARLRLL